MKGRASIASLAATVALSAGPATAQQPGAHDHGTGQLGRVTFPVSCSAEAGGRFEHAMAVLHSFWWAEGSRAFTAVLEADSTCAMAYWGLAMNAWGNPFVGGPNGAALTRGADAARRASALAPSGRRERGFIAAVAALYRDADTTPNSTRLQAYADTMAGLHRLLPADTEVAIYYALALVATASRGDTTFSQQKRAIAILSPLFARYPNHPGLAHYTIHSADSPQLAALGLDAARRYARIAPAAPHAQHMPSHIFVRLGLWDETIRSNWKSYDAGIAHAKSAGLPAATYDEHHALDYAVYAYLQRGQDSAAQAAAAVGQRLEILPVQNLLVGKYNLTAMAARIPLERGDWAAAAAFPAPGPGEINVAAALSRFTRALGAARSGHPDAAKADVAVMDTIVAKLEQGKETYWARIATIKRDAAAAWIRFALGDTTGALTQARTAADSEEVTDKHPVTPAELLPARELYADMLLAARRYGEAREAYRATLARERKRARSLFGAARSAELAGDRSAASAGYREFLDQMARADSPRPELATARAFGR